MTTTTTLLRSTRLRRNDAHRLFHHPATDLVVVVAIYLAMSDFARMAFWPKNGRFETILCLLVCLNGWGIPLIVKQAGFEPMLLNSRLLATCPIDGEKLLVAQDSHRFDSLSLEEEQ